jgi:hypothetical protein
MENLARLIQFVSIFILSLEEIQCPTCDQKCWISEKKRQLFKDGGKNWRMFNI